MMKRKIISVALAFVLLMISFTVTVEAAPKISKTETTIYVGKTINLKVNGTKSKVNWSSSNQKIATVSKTGKVTGIKAGKVIITAKIKNQKYRCTVIVKSPALNKNKITLKTGQKYQLKLSGYSVKKWSVKNNKIASINKSGVVTAKNTGKTTITCKGNNGKTYYCSLTVTHAHKYKTYKVYNASCTSDGTVTYKCSCGKTYANKIAPIGHMYVLDQTVNSTCSKEGCYIYKCKNCGDSYKKTIPKKDHEFEFQLGKQPCCIEEGYNIYHCKNCSEEKKEILPKTSHSYSEEIRVNPTCTEGGYILKVCDVCGKENKEILSALNHDYSVLIEEVKPTCYSDGYKIYRCKNCDETTKIDEKKVSHKYEIVKLEPTCVTYGYERDICIYCGDIMYDQIKYLIPHSYEISEEVAPTCTENGYTEYRCDMCNDTYRTTIEALNHDYEKTKEVEADCNTIGYIEYKCNNCGEIKTEKTSDKKHLFKEVNRDLEYRYFKCEKCNEEMKEYNDQEYTIDIGNGKTATVVGHYNLSMVKEIFELTNEERARYKDVLGCKPLTLAESGSKLEEVAMIRAVEISYKLDHYRPNGERAISSFYAYANTDGENIAGGYLTSKAVVDAWCESMDHWQGMTNHYYQRIGIASFSRKVEDGVYSKFHVQLFTKTITEEFLS